MTASRAAYAFAKLKFPGRDKIFLCYLSTMMIPWYVILIPQFFIMQKLHGTGMAFVEIDGYVVEYELQAGQQMLIDTGYLAAMEATCSMDIQTVPGVKNMLFGGEGIFNTVITGPGHIWLQTMPISNVAGAISPFIPSKS